MVWKLAFQKLRKNIWRSKRCLAPLGFSTGFRRLFPTLPNRFFKVPDIPLTHSHLSEGLVLLGFTFQNPRKSKQNNQKNYQNIRPKINTRKANPGLVRPQQITAARWLSPVPFWPRLRTAWRQNSKIYS